MIFQTGVFDGTKNVAFWVQYDGTVCALFLCCRFRVLSKGDVPVRRLSVAVDIRRSGAPVDFAP